VSITKYEPNRRVRRVFYASSSVRCVEGFESAPGAGY
jgi:hypothetical protein